MSRRRERGDTSRPQGGRAKGDGRRGTGSETSQALDVEVLDVEVLDGNDPEEVDPDAGVGAFVDAEAVEAESSQTSMRARVVEVPAADEDADEVDPLAEVGEVSDAELDAIARTLLPGSAAPEGTTALARRDPMAAYMAEVRRYPLLSREEEHELARRWVEQGDREAGRQLVTANLRLVVKLANEYRRGYQNLLDLVQEGNVGLVKAVDRFDPYRGIKLSTYAAWWIRAYILKYILANWRLVKLGTTQNQRKLFYNLNKQRRKLEAAGIEPTSENLADALDVSNEEVVEMQKRLSAPDASLNAPASADDDSGGRTKLDMLSSEGADFDPAGTVEAAEFRQLLSEKLRRFGADLEGREAELFSERLLSDEPITLQDLGTRWGVSRERARQVEKRMMLRLRGFLKDELGDAVQIALGGE